MRWSATTLVAVCLGLCALIVWPVPSHALPLGWTASGTGWSDDGGTSSGSTVTLSTEVDLAAGSSTTVTFEHDGSNPGGVLNRTQGGDTFMETFFSITLAYDNIGTVPVTGLIITITDSNSKAETADNLGHSRSDHPEAAHIHPSIWNNNSTTSPFDCVGTCDFTGVFMMVLGPSEQNNPVQPQDVPIGAGTLRLHDIEDKVKDQGFGTMKFTLTILAVPEPATGFLLALGLVAIAARKRRAARHYSTE